MPIKFEALPVKPPDVKKVYLGDDLVYQDFSLPDGYTEVEYITSAGAAFASSGVKIDQDCEIRAKMRRTTSNYNMYGYGATNSDNTASVTHYLTSAGVNQRFGAQTASLQSSLFGLNADYTIIHNGQGFNLNGTLYPYASEVADFITPYPLCIMACRNGQSTYNSNKYRGRLYYFRILKNREYLFYGIPAKNSGGTYGLYDAVGKRFITSQTATAFGGA